MRHKAAPVGYVPGTALSVGKPLCGIVRSASSPRFCFCADTKTSAIGTIRQRKIHPFASCRDAAAFVIGDFCRKEIASRDNGMTKSGALIGRPARPQRGNQNNPVTQKAAALGWTAAQCTTEPALAELPSAGGYPPLGGITSLSRLPQTPSACGCGSDGAACAAPWLRSAGCVRASPGSSARLPPACAPTRLPARTAS